MSDDGQLDNLETEAEAETRLGAIRVQRIADVTKLREAGIEPYPSGPFEKISTMQALGLSDDEEATIAGRIMLFRVMGNIAFGQLHDESGEIQFVLSKKEMEEEPGFKFFTKNLGMGDFISVTGHRMTTHKGEPSVNARQVTILSKAIRPLPDKHLGLKDEDTRLRKRYLDILTHRDVQDMVYKRAKFWKSMRTFLDDRGFTEVETPVLEHTTGGADAKPFITHHNYLDADVALRISMGELWQKRLLVAGLEKVYEIGRQFRNENQSREHLNDYTQMEFYWAYANYEWGMQLVEEMFKYIAQETFGTLQFTMNRNAQTYEVDLSGKWERYDYVETIERISGLNISTASHAEITQKLKDLHVFQEEHSSSVERAIDGLWKYCRRHITGPGFLINEPVALSPLAKRSPHNPDVAERFHVLIAGSELGNGYSELNDPIDQAERFDTQQAMRDAGDAEAQEADPEFVEALEYGMPPAFGFGVSERAFAFFMDRSVRECQIFPLLRH